MPRRNQRSKTGAPEVILGDDYRFTRDPEEAERRRERRKQRADESRKRLIERSKGNWSTCVVPGCRFTVPRELFGEIEFPVCTPHAVAVWMQIEQKSHDPSIQEATAALRARRQIIADEWNAEEQRLEDEYRKRYAAGLVDGHIYFIRANGLVKVGWSSDVESRLRSYGPNIEILCIYPGKRQDETTLHRQLKPSRAKGREWYHEDAIIRDFTAEAVAKHGAPKLKVIWSGPGEVVAGKRVVGRR